MEARAPYSANQPSAITIAERLACAVSRCACQPTARSGKGETHCPAHDDEHPSLSVGEKHGTVLVICRTGCSQVAVIAALRKRDLWPDRPQRRRQHGASLSPPVKAVTALPPPSGLTVEQLATAKALDITGLQAVGVCNTTHNGVARVQIPYRDEKGVEQTLRYRLALIGAKRFIYHRGHHPMLYGLWRLDSIRAAGWVLVVEGESDSWTGWQYDLPVVGVPGKTAWQAEWAQHLAGSTVYVWQEPGAEDFPERIGRDLQGVRVIVAPDGTKDLSEAHLQGMDVRAKLEAWRAAAPTLTELAQQRRDADRIALQTAAAPVLAEADPLERVGTAIRALGYGGNLDPAVLTYLGITSRLLAMRPGAMLVHLLLLGPPSAGKSYTLGLVLRLLPRSAYHVIDAGSARVLIYDDADLEHRVLVFGEADSLPAGEDNTAASAVRNLLQDGYLHYKVTVRDAETGGYTVREVDKPGPTMLVTTSTRRLGTQLDSRLFSVELPDDQNQIRHALTAQADLELNGAREPDGALIAYQELLQLQAPWDVLVPFAGTLAERIGQQPAAPRISRDFARLLSLIKAVAVLRHAQRTRDAHGRLVATVADYTTVYELLNDVYQGSVTGASAQVRAAVDAVSALLTGSTTTSVSATKVAEQLAISKMSASRRVNGAIRAGYLVNEESRKGHPMALKLGDPLPPEGGLPDPATLGCNTVTASTAGDTPPRVQGAIYQNGVTPHCMARGCSNPITHVNWCAAHAPREEVPTR